MKINFILKAYQFLTLSFLLVGFSLNLFAQSSELVTVTSNVFTPKELNITAGDEVVWMNTQGNHNVDGNKSIFPDNPESFGNEVGSGWTYKFVFNTPGTYDYQCDPHAGIGMVGKIIVNPKVATLAQLFAESSAKLRLFPNPATQLIELTIPKDYGRISSIKIFSIAGTVIDEMVFSGNSEQVRYNISLFRNGIYFMEINSGTRKDVLKFVKQ